MNQIRQGFGEQEVYPSIEEKAAMLLYLVVKNHAFVDGNKQSPLLAFCCFWSEMETVRRLLVSVLNRNIK